MSHDTGHMMQVTCSCWRK